MNKFIATTNDQGRTILKFISIMFSKVSHAKIEKIFRTKKVYINNVKIKNKKTLIKNGDVIQVYGLWFENKKPIQKIQTQFQIVFEDTNILIINKPEKMVVHGSQTSIDNQVLSYLNFQKVDSFTPAHIGRLDKVTSGLMVYAKKYQVLREMNDKKNFFEKTYRAITNLKIKTTVEALIIYDQKQQKAIVNHQNGKKCKTEFTPIGHNKLEIKTFTGRKHQIRASLAYLNAPIRGDTKYNGHQDKRVYLHCYKIMFKNLGGIIKYLNNKEFVSEENFGLTRKN